MNIQSPETGYPRTVGEKLMLINGQYVAARSEKVIQIFDPSTGQSIGSSPEADEIDVNLAVEAARQSFESGIWKDIHPSERAKVLFRLADLVEEHGRELAHLEALNSGMLFPLAQMNVAQVADTFRYYAGWATKIHGVTSEISSSMIGAFHAYSLKEPVGVCGLIVPWNFPLILATVKLAPALAVGCSCIVKPSEETPFSTLRLVELFHEAGLPDGVLNVITGYGKVAGAAMAKHDGIDKVAFTGSTEVGKEIVRAAAGNLKRVTLELGGKSPVVVFDDCNIEHAIAGTAMGIFIRTGQICIAGSRLYVQKKSFDRVVEGIAAIASNMKVGDTFAPDTQIGPIISNRQTERVLGLIQSGVSQGANLVLGGKRREGDGYFIEPTIFTDLKPDARLIREEVFGPVICATRFDDINDVVKAANDSHYGLTSAVWTNDIKKAHLMAKKLQAGMVWINCALVTDPSLPAGGYKQSGWGAEMGKEGVDAYLKTKSVYASLN